MLFRLAKVVLVFYDNLVCDQWQASSNGFNSSGWVTVDDGIDREDEVAQIVAKVAVHRSSKVVDTFLSQKMLIIFVGLVRH